MDEGGRKPTANSTYKKLAVQWLIEHSTLHQILWYVDSFVLRNPLLRKAAKRWNEIRFAKTCYALRALAPFHGLRSIGGA